MPAGAKPGERRGGRAKGTPNKSAIDRRLAVQQATGIEYAERLGRMTLAKMSFELEVLAEKYHPDRGEAPNEEMFCKYAVMAADIASKLAPYQSPKLAAVYTSSATKSALERVGSVEREIYDEFMMEIAEKGVPRQAQAYLSKPTKNGNGSGSNGGGVANR